MKAVLTIVFISLLVLSACSAKSSPQSHGTQMANPASRNCVDKGYNNTIITNPDGSQTGYCVFPDDHRCEEWAFFRGECA